MGENDAKEHRLQTANNEPLRLDEIIHAQNIFDGYMRIEILSTLSNNFEILSEDVIIYVIVFEIKIKSLMKKHFDYLRR